MAQIGKTIMKFQSSREALSLWDQMQSTAQVFYQASQFCVTKTCQNLGNF